MDILKTSIEWTRAEMLSSAFFVAFGVVFILTSLGFWQIGKTDLAKAFVIPTLVSGGLLAVIGIGIFVQSYGRVTGFAEAYNQDAAAFIASEIKRASRVLNDYQIAVFRIIPLIVAMCAVLLIVVHAPLWRAALVTTIAMMSVILIVDTNAHARLGIYKAKLLEADQGR